MSENNSIVAIDKEILTMMDFDKFNSLYSVSRHLSFTFGEIPPERYIDEAVWRYNTRGVKGGERFSHMFRSSIGAVDYGMVKQVA